MKCIYAVVLAASLFGDVDAAIAPTTTQLPKIELPKNFPKVKIPDVQNPEIDAIINGAKQEQQAEDDAAAAKVAEAAAAAAAKQQRLTPAVKTRDDTFYKKQYPNDVQHPYVVGRISKNIPYPAVQKSSTYDQDYPKDENQDKGDKATWDMQIKYSNGVKKAYEEWLKYQEALKKAKVDVINTQQEEAQKREFLKKLEEMKTEIKATTKHVKAEVTDVEGCEKELKIQRDKLVRLQKEAKDAAEADEKVENDLRNHQVAGKVLWDEEDVRAKKTAEEKKEYEAAVDKQMNEQDHVKQMEKDLVTAEKKLRSFRVKGAHPGGPVNLKAKAGHGHARSSSVRMAPAMLGVVAMALVIMGVV